MWRRSRFLGVRAPPAVTGWGHAPDTRPPDDPDEWELDMVVSGALLGDELTSGGVTPHRHPPLMVRGHWWRGAPGDEGSLVANGLWCGEGGPGGEEHLMVRETCW